MLEPEHETDTLARIGRDTPLYLRRAEADGGPLRHTLEAFIRQRFADEHQARIRHFLPCLLGLLDEHGVVQGAVGLRPARQPLFLERYLDAPLEGEIARRHARQVPRDAIVEVGNLAATGAASARLLIVALTDLLISEGFQWVAFTGTRELLNSFQRLGLAPLPLGEADPARLGAEREDWELLRQPAAGDGRRDPARPPAIAAAGDVCASRPSAALPRRAGPCRRLLNGSGSAWPHTAARR